MFTSRTIALFTLALTLTACNRPAAPDDITGGNTAPAKEAASTAGNPAPSEFGKTLLWADPLSTCEGAQITTIHWSKEAVALGPARIELGDNNPGVFARIGDAGEKQTGPWAAPGGAVVLRGDDGKARARLTFKGPEDCDAK